MFTVTEGCVENSDVVGVGDVAGDVGGSGLGVGGTIGVSLVTVKYMVVGLVL